jgi:O-antigen biosynthesis protein
VTATVAHAVARAWASLTWSSDPSSGRLPLTAWLYLVQPLARLSGRLAYGLTPWRYRGPVVFQLPRPRTLTVWSEEWEPDEVRLGRLEARLRSQTTGLLRGGDFDRWDLLIRSGALGAARLQMAVEEHGAGKQLARFRIQPKFSRGGALLALALAGLAVAQRAEIVTAAFLGALALVILLRMFYESAAAIAVLEQAVVDQAEERNGDLALTLQRRVSEPREKALTATRGSR